MDSVALSVKLFEIFGFESGRRKFEGREKEKDMKAVIFYVAFYSQYFNYVHYMKWLAKQFPHSDQA